MYCKTILRISSVLRKFYYLYSNIQIKLVRQARNCRYKKRSISGILRALPNGRHTVYLK